VGPDVAQQEFVPKLSLHISSAGSVEFHLSVAVVDALGHLQDVFAYTPDALPFKVVVEPLMDLFFSKVTVEVRFFPLKDSGGPPIHVLLGCHSHPSFVQEIDSSVMAGAKVGVELNIWVREAVLLGVMFTETI
jgi:hypothetical protein